MPYIYYIIYQYSNKISEYSNVYSRVLKYNIAISTKFTKLRRLRDGQTLPAKCCDLNSYLVVHVNNQQSRRTHVQAGVILYLALLLCTLTQN